MGGENIPTKKPFLKVHKLQYAFPGSTNAPVLSDVSFNVQPHEFTALVGPSGIGKTTLLRLLAGLISPTSGEIKINNEPVQTTRHRIGLVFQHHTSFPWLTVEQNIAFGLKTRQLSPEMRRQKTEQLLHAIQLKSHSNQYPHQLSGGQQQRLALARTLIQEPAVLLLDEPFASLDHHSRSELHEVLQKIQQELKPTTILVTHDLEEALYLADRIILLQKHPAKVSAVISNPFAKPRNPELKYTEAFQQERRKLAQLIQNKQTM